MDQKLLITNVLILKLPGTHNKTKNRSISAIGGSTSAVVLVHNVFSVEYKVFIWPPREAPNSAKCANWSWLFKKTVFELVVFIVVVV